MQNGFKVAKEAAGVGDAVGGEGAVQDEAVGRGLAGGGGEREISTPCPRCATRGTADAHAANSASNAPGLTREKQAEMLSRIVSAAILGVGTSTFEGEVRQAIDALSAAREAPKQAPFSIAQAAKRLCVSTCRTLAPAIAAGLVVTIPWGRRRRISVDEIERLEREGIGGKKKCSNRPPKKSGAKEARSAKATTPRARLSYADALAGK